MTETVRHHHLRRGVSVRPHPMLIRQRVLGVVGPNIMNDLLRNAHEENEKAIRDLDARLDASRMADAERLRVDTSRLNRVLSEQREREIPLGAR